MTDLALPLGDEPASGIPALIDRARARLSEARSSAEVLEAKKIAELALHYSKVTRAANDTHADCLRIITRAEIRMADEIDRGQESGEVRTRADNQHVRTSDKLSQPKDTSPEQVPVSYADLGIDRQRVAEWREVRDAGPAVVEQAIQAALAEDRPPTKADIQKHVRGTFGTGENEWYTPQEYLEAARAALGGIDLDPATSETAQAKVKAANIFTKETDGLKQEWHGKVWLNPPYAQPFIAEFVSKLVAEKTDGHVESAILLTHNYTDTAWFHEAASIADAICFTRGRVKFYDASGATAAPTQGQAFTYYGADTESFHREFSRFGLIVRPVRA